MAPRPQLAQGYAEVALGVLSEDEAVALLLGTAELKSPTPPQTAVGKTISKIVGYLPLYITMVGR